MDDHNNLKQICIKSFSQFHRFKSMIPASEKQMNFTGNCCMPNGMSPDFSHPKKSRKLIGTHWKNPKTFVRNTTSMFQRFLELDLGIDY